jgi:hypothetical protein
MQTERSIKPATTLTLLAIGGLGGWGAHFTPLPLPYMLGSLLAAASLSMASARHLPTGYHFPQTLRIGFIAIIGMLIGARVTPELVSDLHALTYSLIAISLFVIAAQAANYLIFHRIGGMDRTTAFFAGAPGGLIESITLGEAAGADIRQLVMQQFLRIIFVVALVPISISLWLGHPVGSADGFSLSTTTTLPPAQIALILATGGIGIMAGRALHLPAWQLTGPLAAAAALGLTGIATLDMPQWLVNIAQIVVGTSLGVRFVGLSRTMLLRGLWLSLLSVTTMLAIGATLALIIRPLTGQPFDVLMITFAPGGVTEMGLIALSLQANPAFVTLHHIYRITLTVILLGFGAKRLTPPPNTK